MRQPELLWSRADERRQLLRSAVTGSISSARRAGSRLAEQCGTLERFRGSPLADVAYNADHRHVGLPEPERPPGTTRSNGPVFSGRF